MSGTSYAGLLRAASASPEVWRGYDGDCTVLVILEALMDTQTLDDYHFLQLNEELLQNPYPFFTLLRQHAPVYREPDYGVYLVSRYDDIIEVDRQADVFSHIDLSMAPYRDLPAAVDALPQWRDSQPFVDRILSNDPPDHDRYRRLLVSLYRPGRVARLEPRVRELANELIDEFIDDGSVDFVESYANILPRLVMGEFMGVPRADGELLQVRGRGRSRSASPTPKTDFQRWLDVRCQYSYEDDMRPNEMVTDYFSDALRERRKNPREDLLSVFADARFPDGSEVPLNVLTSMMELLYRTGCADDPPELLKHLMLTMMRFGEVEPELRANPTLIAPFIEEVMRYETPMLGLFRVALRDTSVGGVPIRKGGVVMVLYASANRDETYYESADSFELRRYCTSTKRHLSFSHGAHACVGASLARLQAKVTTEEVLRRMKNIRFPDRETSLPYAASLILRLIARLDVAFDKVGA